MCSSFERLDRVARHYRDFLGAHYRWTVSGSGEPEVRARSWLEARGLLEATKVLDLGAGFGAFSLPLLEAGASVTAVDLDAGLLEQLVDRAEGRPVTCVEGDLVRHVESTDDRYDLVLCMGDTLTHLPQFDAVARLIRGVARLLAKSGKFAVTWRDNSGPLPSGTDRFLTVARSTDRAMHCLLERLDSDRIRVTDMLTQTHVDGPRVTFSDYEKLRLSAKRVDAWGAKAGLVLAHADNEGGMTERIFTPG